MVLMGVVAVLPAAQAHGAFPGANGRIVIAGGCNMWTVNPDGSDRRQITFESCDGIHPREPEWSPDGTKIAYSKDPDVHIVNADGSGDVNITNGLAGAAAKPDWSPDGTQIAFVHSAPGSSERHIVIANSDGTTPVPLMPSMCTSDIPLWNPNGERIAFLGYKTSPSGCVPDAWFTAKPDGTGLAKLTISGLYDWDWSPDGGKVVFPGAIDPYAQFVVQVADASSPREPFSSDQADGHTPVFSPDGTKLAFVSYYAEPESTFVVSREGNGITKIWPFFTYGLDWQPIPVNAYVRPKGASPTDVPLVPAYEPCDASTSANRTHGPPLAFPACAPPVQKPGQLTVGTPDANGQPAKLRANVRINPLRGLPSTPIDEADVRLRATINDVRLRSDLSDYTGNLDLRLTLQVTDRDNTPHPGGSGPATVQQLIHSHPLPCSATADATVGSSCDADTTIEALVPGAVKELQRAIWELDAIRVHDGAGNLFMTQGVFVP